MNDCDWVIYYLQQFQENRDAAFLEKALKSYNDFLESNLAPRKLITISQYTDEAFKIGDETQKEKLSEQINKIVKNLETTKEITVVDSDLMQLANISSEIVGQHAKTFGFKPKYPWRMIFWRTARRSAGKILPQLLYIAIIFIVLALAASILGIHNISIPSI